MIDPESGIRFRLHQDDSLFLVPEDWEWDDATESFRPPESDTLMRFELPSYWASYLINGDDSGISAEDKAHCDAFIARESLSNWTCAGKVVVECLYSGKVVQVEGKSFSNGNGNPVVVSFADGFVS